MPTELSLSPLSAPLTTIAYCLLLSTRTNKVTRDIKQWTPDSIDRLQGCFEATDWNILTSSSTNISEQVETISAYISFCVDNVIPSKKVTIFPNNKP